MKCNYCNQMIPEEKVQKKGHAPERRYHNMYCDMACYRKSRATKKPNCVQCGEKARKHKDLWIGRELCSECYKTKICGLFTNDEVMYLVSINPGVGLKYFVKKLWPKSHAGIKNQERLRYFLEEIGEYDGNDYVNWLENPKMMRRVLQDDVPEELLWSIIGERRSIVSNQVKRARMRDGLPVKDRNNYYVYIPPLFRWGKLEELKTKIFEE